MEWSLINKKTKKVYFDGTPELYSFLKRWGRKNRE